MNWLKGAAAILNASIATFGVDVIYTPKATGVPQNIRGIFDNQFQNINFSDVSGIGSTSPALGIRIADLLAPPKQDDHLAIGTDNFRVVENRVDGQGGSTLILHKI